MLANLIKTKYPNLIINKDFIIQDDGNGAYIKEWNNANPKPSIDELLLLQTSTENKLIKEARIAEILKELDKNDLKAIRSIAENDNVRINEHKLKQQALREELNNLKK